MATEATDQKGCKHGELVHIVLYQLYGNRVIIRHGQVDPGDESFSPIHQVFIECGECGFKHTYEADALPKWVHRHIDTVKDFMLAQADKEKTKG